MDSCFRRNDRGVFSDFRVLRLFTLRRGVISFSELATDFGNLSISPGIDHWIPAFAGMTACYKSVSFLRKQESIGLRCYMVNPNLLRTYRFCYEESSA